MGYLAHEDPAPIFGNFNTPSGRFLPNRNINHHFNHEQDRSDSALDKGTIIQGDVNHVAIDIMGKFFYNNNMTEMYYKIRGKI